MRSGEGEQGANGIVKGALLVAAIAFVVRLPVLMWAFGRIGLAGDGAYYDAFARRIADGAGYTWAWPDGTVTYAAHYPVGYPAWLGALYAVFGSHVEVAMLGNAVLASAGMAAWCTGLGYVVGSTDSSRRAACFAAIAAAVHPALVLYTPALMTEAVCVHLACIAFAVAMATRHGRLGANAGAAWVGVALGLATLVRPQSILFAPLFGAIASPRPRDEARAVLRSRLFQVFSARRLGSMALAVSVSLGVCAPWAARNCARMNRCALVSMNGGWNLLIGTQTEAGGFAPLRVPAECATVWSEAEKDDCFGRVARHVIAKDVWGAVRRVPAKLGATFDYFGAGPWYLHESNPEAFSETAKVAAGAIETVICRITLAVALMGAMGTVGRHRHKRRLVVHGALAIGLAGVPHAYVGYLVLAGLLGRRAMKPRDEARDMAPLDAATSYTIGVTALVHATFFGAGRYGLVLVPFVVAQSFAWARRPVGEGTYASLPSG